MALAHSPSIVTNGLVLYLDAANPRSYSGSGTTWTDLSGNGNNATLVNGVGFNSDRGGSLTFNGTSHYLSLNSIISDKPFTISFWFKINSSKNQSLYTSRTVLGSGISVFLLTNTMRFDTGSQQSISYDVPISNIINLNLITNNSNKLLFVNGQLQASYSFASTIDNISSTLATIGASQISGSSLGNYLDGSIYNYSIYNKALTADEVRQNYDALKGRYI